MIDETGQSGPLEGAGGALRAQSAVTGFKTFLLSDIRGYSSFAAARGDEAAAALADRFAAIAERVITEFGGISIGNRGDEVLTAFDSPRQAIRAAVAFQQALLDATREEPALPLPAGVGLDVGEAVVVSEGWRANAINVAARLCSIAKGGEILATREVIHLAQAVDGVRYIPRPAVRLKGIAEPVSPIRVLTASGDTARAFAALGFTRAEAPPPARRAPRKLMALAIAAVVLAAALTASILIVSGGGTGVVLAADELGAIDTGSAQVTLGVPLRDPPTSVAVGSDGTLWVTSTTAGILSRIDRRTHVVTRIPVGAEPAGVAVAPDGSVWVANSGDATVSRVSPQNDAVTDTVHVGAGPTALLATGRALWVADTLDASVTKIDLASDSVSATIPVGSEPVGIAAGGQSIWVADQGDSTVYRLDGVTGSPLLGPLSVGAGPTHVAYGDGAAWVTNGLDGSLSRIDAQSNSVATVPVGQGPYAVVVRRHQIWVSNEFGNDVAVVDPATLSVTRRIEMSSAPLGLALAGDRVWVAADGEGASAHRGGVVYAAATNVSGYPDPPAIDVGSAYTTQLWRLLAMTNDGLVGYRRAGGVAGNGLVPDLAASLPTPTDNGLTYVFRIRSGIRYSNGDPLRASDFRRGLERAFEVGGGPTPYFTTLVGGAGCAQHPRCDLSRGVVADDAAGTVTFHLTAADPDFLYQLTLPAADPVPPRTPVHLRRGSVPGTGPYEISRYSPADPHKPRSRGQLVLTRNGFFRQWSAAAQPNGFPDRIVINTGYSLPAELAAIEHGRADLAWDEPPRGELARLRGDFPAQLHINPLNEVGFVWLNTRITPFDNVLARRAFNYAVDRGALNSYARSPWFGGLTTCQLLPPNFPGYVRYCPYTLNPTATGRWLAPDVGNAQALVRQSRTAGARVVLVQPSDVGRRFGLSLVATLRAIGYRASLRSFPPNTYWSRFFNPTGQSRHIQAGLSDWAVDYLASSNVVGLLVRCSQVTTQGVNIGRFCDRSVDARINRALADQQQRAGIAAEEWTAVDRLEVDKAATVPISNGLTADFVSTRVGNYQHNPLLGILVDQLWVR
jgi:peptide/nickel transport system substrate-binding protein